MDISTPVRLFSLPLSWLPHPLEPTLYNPLVMAFDKLVRDTLSRNGA